MGETDFGELAAKIKGRVSVAGEVAWESDRLPWALIADQRPAAVALPADADDVRAVVDFAREAGLRVAAQGTGHGAGPMEELSGTILVKTSEMTGVEVDPDAGRARALAGALSGDVMNAGAEHGRAGLCGSSPGGREYFNFAENPGDAASYYGGDACARLREVRAKVDPDGIFQANHDLAA